MGIRSIEFRGKRQKNGEWVYGDLLQIPKHELYSIMHEKEDTGNFLVDKNTIGQYTGLCDKNGTRIFEGDIVESRASENKEDWKYWQVIFYDGSYCFEREFKKRKYKHEQNLLCEDAINLYGLIVIGNIYDNPELLKGAEK